MSIPNPAPIDLTAPGQDRPAQDPADSTIWRCNIAIFRIPDRGCNPFLGMGTCYPSQGPRETHEMLPKSKAKSGGKSSGFGAKSPRHSLVCGPAGGLYEAFGGLKTA
jgi:hypothetical protein